MRHRAPFVWTPEQPIDPSVVAVGLMGGTPPPREEGLNRWFLCRRIFELDAAPQEAKLSIACDGRYRLFVNGEEAGRGPARCTPTFQRYDTHDVADRLQPGRNVVAVLVHTYGLDTSWYEMNRDLAAQVFGDGGLWCVLDADGREVMTTGTEWRILQSDAWAQDVPTGNHGLGFIEVLDGAKLPEGWAEADFDDSGWPEAVIQRAGGGGPDAFFGGLAFEPFPVLIPNPLPPMAGGFAAPERVLWQREATPRVGSPVQEQAYAEELDAETRFDLSPLAEGDAVSLRTEPDGAVCVLLDFGRIVTGYPCFELDARGGEEVDVAVAESVPGEWEEGFDASSARIAPDPQLGLDVHLSCYAARPGKQRFERFEWQAVRYMQVTLRRAPDGVTLSGLGVRTCNYDAEARGRFDCDDAFLNRLWTVGRYTLHQCMHDAWEDCPSREQRQWLGDATVENLVGHAAFGPSVAPLNAEFLRKVAESQRQDGLTQMFAPGNHGRDRLLIPDWTLQWVLNAGDHLLWTNDLETIRQVYPSVLKALAWFERLRGGAPLVPNVPHWSFFDWAALGRDGYACTLNAQAAGAMDAGASMARALGDEREADRLASVANALRAGLEGHWDEARGAYVDVVDPASGERRPRVSQHANAAMILWGGAPEGRWARMIERITDRDRLRFTAAPPIKPEGETLDEQEHVVLANTFYSHFVYEALNAAGRTDLVLEQVRRDYGPMLEAGATTLWESWGPTASLCHGFSASPTYQLSTAVLGVRPTEPGGTAIRFAPNLAGLPRAEGVIPLTSGDVAVGLESTRDGMRATLRTPSGVAVEVVAPPGMAVSDDQGDRSAREIIFAHRWGRRVG